MTLPFPLWFFCFIFSSLLIVLTWEQFNLVHFLKILKTSKLPCGLFLTWEAPTKAQRWLYLGCPNISAFDYSEDERLVGCWSYGSDMEAPIPLLRNLWFRWEREATSRKLQQVKSLSWAETWRVWVKGTFSGSWRRLSQTSILAGGGVKKSRQGPKGAHSRKAMGIKASSSSWLQVHFIRKLNISYLNDWFVKSFFFQRVALFFISNLWRKVGPSPCDPEDEGLL